MDSKCDMYFFDESRFGTHSNIGHGWFKKGKTRDNLNYKLGYKNFYLYSSVNPINGDNFSLIMPNVNTDNFNLYLQHLSKHLKNQNRTALLVMDGAGWHKSKDLIKFDNIEFIIQPSYSPELNPIEKLWQYIKRHTIKNKVFKTLQDIEKELCKFLQKMRIEDYKSVCNVKYI